MYVHTKMIIFIDSQISSNVANIIVGMFSSSDKLKNFSTKVKFKTKDRYRDTFWLVQMYSCKAYSKTQQHNTFSN